jgi:tape measure domain-containing protein
MADITKTVQILFQTAGAGITAQDFIDVNIALDRVQFTLKDVTGSSEAAAAEWQFLETTARQLGLGITELARPYAKLFEATKGTNLEGQTTRDLFLGIASAGARLGLSTVEVERALKAVEQIASKGRVSLEEVRGQLGDAIPGAVPLFAKAAGKSVDEFFKLVEAGELSSDVLVDVARLLNQKYAVGPGEQIDTLAASFGRLRTSWELFAKSIGEAGFNTAIIVSLGAVTNFIEVTTKAVTNLDTVLGKIFGFRTDDEKTADALKARLAQLEEIANSRLTVFQRIDKDLQELGIFKPQKVEGFVPSQIGEEADKIRQTFNLMEKASYEAFETIRKEAYFTGTELQKFTKDTKGLDATLKALGIDPNQFEKPIQLILNEFNELSNNPIVTGEKWLSGFLVVLDKIKDGPDGLPAINTIVFNLDQAQKKGILTTEQYVAALAALEQKTNGNWGSIIRTTEADKEREKQLKKTTEETRKAEEAARTYQLKLEEIASNERIKVIEARVQLNVAELEAQTKQIEAAFGSINAGIENTGDVITKLFELYSDASTGPSSRLRDAIEEQLKSENQYRKQEFDLQKRLTEAKIKEIENRAQSFASGNPLIQIEGAGLQPHLEAFMWEILKTIQTRVNADGLELLLGSPA